ncbi:MAG: signal recognition particle-docking protein FtsY [Clostridia bacterium]|nr:signal recognition particle-docking protein FtsY [Clostridia bacterium]
MAIFEKFSFGLKKSRKKMAGAIEEMLDSFESFSDDLYTELEEILVMSDVGVETAVEITEKLKKRVDSENLKSTKQVKNEIKEIVAEMLEGGEDMGLITQPSIILMIGVNGAGKTTTIGKLAAMYKSQGKQVIMAAADTFRAAAIDQLAVWAQRAGVDIIKHEEGSDPAAVIFDAIQAGKARYTDIILCDTAGRLHNKKNLMDELNKIYRVIDRELPYSDREVLLVLDATTGQNAVNQAREFMQVCDLTGIVLTKLDGTARGGVVLSIKNELKLPVKFIGVGEGIDDLQPFKPRLFAESLFDELPENYKEKEDEVLPVYEQPLETFDISERVEAERAVKEVFEELFGSDEDEEAGGSEAQPGSEGESAAGRDVGASEEAEVFHSYGEAGRKPDVEDGEGGGYGSVSDRADKLENDSEGESSEDDRTAAPGGAGSDPQPQETAGETEETQAENGGGENKPADGDSEDSELDDLYGSIDQFFI